MFSGAKQLFLAFLQQDALFAVLSESFETNKSSKS